jgi:hypothetical protein
LRDRLSDVAKLAKEGVPEANSPLRSLLEQIAKQAEKLRADLERLYDDSFIETADDGAG